MSNQISIVRQRQRNQREEEQKPRNKPTLTEKQRAELNRQRFEERTDERLYSRRNIPVSSILKAEVLHDNQD